MKQKKFDQNHISLQSASGLTAREYCRQNDINYHTLKYWQQKHRSQSEDVQSGFIAVQPATPADSWIIELSSRGIRLKFDFDWKFHGA